MPQEPSSRPQPQHWTMFLDPGLHGLVQYWEGGWQPHRKSNVLFVIVLAQSSATLAGVAAAPSYRHPPQLTRDRCDRVFRGGVAWCHCCRSSYAWKRPGNLLQNVQRDRVLCERGPAHVCTTIILWFFSQDVVPIRISLSVAGQVGMQNTSQTSHHSTAGGLWWEALYTSNIKTFGLGIFQNYVHENYIRIWFQN